MLTQQQAQVRDAAARAQTAEQERADISRMAADDGDVIDNKALGHIIKNTGKNDSDFAEWDPKVRIFIEARFGREILQAMSWAKIRDRRHPS